MDTTPFTTIATFAGWTTNNISAYSTNVFNEITIRSGVSNTLLTSPRISSFSAIDLDMTDGTDDNLTSYDDDGGGGGGGIFDKPTWYLAMISVIYGILIVLTVVGNIFVMVAYHVDIRIRRSVANTFILNLAIADFIVGAFTLPIYFAWNLIGEWIFGEYLCKVWSFVDFTVTAMSVITIILISLDRYWLLSKKTAYASYQTRSRANITVGVCWAVVVSIYLVLTFGWSAILKEYPVDFSVHCDMEFIYFFPSLICVVIVNFAVPAIIIAVLNTMVYYKIRARAKGISALDKTIRRESGAKVTGEGKSFVWRIFRKTNEPALPGVKGDAKGLDPGVILVSITNKQTECHLNPAFERQNEIAPSSSSGGTSGNGSAEDEHSDISPDHENMEPKERTDPEHSKVKNNNEVFSITKTGDRQENGRVSPAKSKSSKLDGLINKLKRKQREFKREKRAAFILAVLVTVFIMCWLPFNITVVVGVACNYACIPETVFIVVENLVWANSAMNPILYAATNVHFRRNFLRFLGFKRIARRLDGPTSVA